MTEPTPAPGQETPDHKPDLEPTPPRFSIIKRLCWPILVVLLMSLFFSIVLYDPNDPSTNLVFGLILIGLLLIAVIRATVLLWIITGSEEGKKPRTPTQVLVKRLGWPFLIVLPLYLFYFIILYDPRDPATNVAFELVLHCLLLVCVYRTAFLLWRMIKRHRQDNAPDAGTSRPRSLARRLLKPIGLGLSAYLLLVGYLWVAHVSDRVVLMPAPGTMPAPDATRLEIPYPHGTLEAFSSNYPRGSDPDICVLLFVGNEDRVNPWVYDVARMWHEQTGLAVEVIGVNLPGFGLSSGSARLDRLAPTGLAAYDACRSRYTDTPIVVQASSVGTTAAFAIAANRTIAALSVQDPLPLRELAMGYHGYWNLWLLAAPVAAMFPSNIDAVANAQKTTAPCLFVTSGADTLIPPRFQQQIFDALDVPREQVVIPNGRHCAQPDAATSQRLAELRGWLLRSAGLLPNT